MKVSVLLHTIDFRGDHAADVAEAHDLIPGETVEALVSRLIVDRSYVTKQAQRIELRVVIEPDVPKTEVPF